MKRRQLLGGAASLTLAGCSSTRHGTVDDTPSTTDRPYDSTPTKPLIGGEAPTDPARGPANYVGNFVLANDDDQPHTVELRVTHDSDVLVDTTWRLYPGARRAFPNPITNQGAYQIEASIEDGATTTTTWYIASCANIEYQVVRVTPDATVEIRTQTQTILAADCDEQNDR